MLKNQTKVGVGVMILKDGKVLLGKRKRSHGTGEYSFPGGHLDYMESFADGVQRETKEECGLEIKNVKFQILTNTIEYKPKHYVNICFTAEWKSGEPEILEPEVHESWDWYSLDNLPSPIFELSRTSIENYGTDVNYFDSK